MFIVGEKVVIASDNENYKEYHDEVIVITGSYNSIEEHSGYDDSLGGIDLYNLVCENGKDFPYSLYEYEIESY